VMTQPYKDSSPPLPGAWHVALTEAFTSASEAFSLSLSDSWMTLKGSSADRRRFITTSHVYQTYPRCLLASLGRLLHSIMTEGHWQVSDLHPHASSVMAKAPVMPISPS
jgi:hypothetical protein